MRVAKQPEIKRITPEEVVEAYKVTGAKVYKGAWFNSNNENECECCGLGVLFLKEVGEENLRNLISTLSGFAVRKTLGINMHYQHGFVTGFDGKSPSIFDTSHENRLGHMDGKAAMEAVTKQLPTSFT